MSKANKLARMKTTVRETTGLSYNLSGETVELNFFPDSTNQGVSVPLVLAGNTNSGVCPAINTNQLLGVPYAYIRDSKPYATSGGNFKSTAITDQAGFNLNGGDGNTIQHYRSRDFNERVIDEIGVSMVEVSSSQDDGGGPGTFLNFPVGTYYISGSAPSFRVLRNMIYWCNFTQAKGLSVADRNPYIVISGLNGYSQSNQNSPVQTRTLIKGRFTVTSPDDSYLLLHGSQNGLDTNGFGVNGDVTQSQYHQQLAISNYSE